MKCLAGYVMGVIVFALLSLFPLPSLAAEVEGVVLCDNGPVDDPQVLAYGTLQESAGGTPLYRSVADEKPGYFRLELPPGKYYLTAAGTFHGAQYFSFHGANPVIVNDEKLWIPFTVTPRTKASIKAADSTKLGGTVTFKGKPVADAQVSLYAASEGQFKGMGLMTRTTGENGAFSFAPEAGDYVVVARKRVAAKGEMPLKKGDLFCYYAGNPLSVAVGKETNIEIPCHPKDDLQAFLEDWSRVKRVNAGLARFRDKASEEAEPFSIAGRVTDLHGKPVAGLYVTAYQGEPGRIFQMHFLRLKSDYMARTDKNGRYTIGVREKGGYYLVARELGGESPLKGELYGLYEGNVDHAVIVEQPLVTADITVGRVMAEAPRKAASGASQHQRYKTLRLGDTVVEQDTEWSGRIEISGRVVVKRGVTLTIRPGTTVRFRRIDRNNDGIGDGEIRVLGRIVAKGTSGRRIRFTSAERVPRKEDWSYLLLFTSGAENIIEQCIFEYAFTGLQAHFSRAVIRDSLFLKNREGLRFGRAELLIEHNDIMGNTYGIRHTRLEGPVTITRNRISGNEVGIFFVPSNQNTVNFSPQRYAVDPQLEMLPLVEQNNIDRNIRYNYQLGERQGYDVSFGRNWWGTVAESDIYAKLYDKNNDDSLGKVNVRPYLKAPVRGAGARGR